MKVTLLIALSISSTVWCSTLSAQSDEQAQTLSQPENELDILMMVVNEDDNPDTIINRIFLPPVHIEKIVFEQSEVSDIEARGAQLDSDELVEAIDQVITDSVSDKIALGEIYDLADDIVDVLPAENIENIIDGVVDEQEEPLPVEGTVLVPTDSL